MITVKLVPCTNPGNASPIELRGDCGQTLMAAAVDQGVADIVAYCGGLATCGACHVYVRSPWDAQLPPPGEQELYMLEWTAAERRPSSRLSCRIRLNETLDGLTVDLPPCQ